MKVRKSAVATAAAIALSGAAAHAQQTETQPQLRGVTVTATRTGAATQDIPATVTTLEREWVDRHLPADDADLFKDEPGVGMARDLRRFGATRVNIRGIEDNRVTQMVDGIRMPDFYNSGGPTNFTMSAPLGTPIDFLKRVEILRGPASSLHGSDALGGVVGFVTLDPSDLLAGGKAQALRYRIGYNGANEGLTQSVLGAWRSGKVEVLLGMSRTQSRELDNFGADDIVGPARTRPNPQDVNDQGLLAKGIWRPVPGHRFGLTLEGREQDARVDVYRLPGSLPKVTAMAGDDSTRRMRASAEWEHRPQGAFYDRLTARLYRQQADTRNSNRQTRGNTGASCSASSGSGNSCVVEQAFRLSQSAGGGNVQFESAVRSAAWDHLLTYGVDVTRVTTDELRDATVRNLTTATTSKSLAGDVFPLRDFAIGRTDTVGVFVQDEISGLAGGRLSITPGLRYDWRRLSPELDALAQQVLTAIGRGAIEKTESAVSPKLAVLWKASPAWSAYGQVVRGFRAPNYDEVNGAFRNVVQGYGTSPNANLEPETSLGTELGLKLHAPQVRGQLALHDTRYSNFIESVALGCPADPRCIAGLSRTFMYVNQSRARIWGAEARAEWDVAPGWKIDAALAYAQGENRSSGRPLNSVDPLRSSVGVARTAAIWGAEARIRAARKVTRTDDSNGAWFRPGGWGVTDLAFWWRPAQGVQLNAAVNNLFDKKHWLWSDIRQADSTNPAGVDFYSQPGRQLALSVKFDL